MLLTTHDLNFTKYAPFAPQLLFVEDLTEENPLKDAFLNWLNMSVFGYAGPKGKNYSDRLATVVCELKENGEMKAILISERNVLAQLKSIRQVFFNVRGERMITDLD